MSFLNVFKHVLPRAKAWDITVDKKLRQFFDGLTGVNDDTRQLFDTVYNNLDPQLTNDLDKWEEQFNLPNASLTEQERRDRLQGAWSATGGQSPGYIQDTLQNAGFQVFVHEWWEPILGRSGGSINNDVTPVARNPFDFLNDETGSSSFLMLDGAELAQDGDELAYDGATGDPVGQLLVNKILGAVQVVISDGSLEMQDGGVEAQDGSSVTVFERVKYQIPNDPTKFPFFLYIGGETFPEQATIPAARQSEFEDLCLKICPTEQWLGLLVDFV